MGARLTIGVGGLHTHNLGALHRGRGEIAKSRVRADMRQMQAGEEVLGPIEQIGRKKIWAAGGLLARSAGPKCGTGWRT